MKKNSITILRAITPIAKRHGLYVSSVMINDNNYATGQGIIPNRPETMNNLTLDEMIGKKPLSDEKARRFPFIIDPFYVYHFSDGHKFDKELFEDNAKLVLISIAAKRVAKNKASIIRGKHDFYLENKEEESQTTISLFQKVIDAGNIINKLQMDDMLDVMSFVAVTTKDSSLFRDMSYNLLMAELVKLAKNKPDLIINSIKPENKNWIHVSKLVRKGVLNMKGGEIYEGKMFVAKDIATLVSIYSSDIDKASRWDNKLNQNKVGSRPVVEVKQAKDNRIEELKDACLLVDKKRVERLYDELKDSKDEAVIKQLRRYSGMISSILEQNVDAIVENDRLDILTDAQLLNSSISDQWVIFKSKFKKAYPDSELKKKEEMINFLKNK